MTQPAKVQEPSMEEILASIRRIIADDEAKPADLAVAAGVGAGMGMASVDPRPESAPRLHNVAAVAPHGSPARDMHGRVEMDPMLAGIEKIVTSSAQNSAMHGASAHDEADVFDLTDEMAIPAAASAFRKVEPKDDIEFADVPPPLAERREPPVAPTAAPSAAPKVDAADILSKTTASAVESAFNSLATTVLSANSRTLEDLVKEMMRPMLKNWLDDNLPGLVERIVKTEIERVARGR